MVFDCAYESQWEGIEFQYWGIGCHMTDWFETAFANHFKPHTKQGLGVRMVSRREDIQ
jgi:hypothetical protein